MSSAPGRGVEQYTAGPSTAPATTTASAAATTTASSPATADAPLPGKLISQAPIRLNPSSRYGEFMYSERHLDGEKKFGEVVLDSFKLVSRDEDNILYQMYKKQICSEFHYKDYYYHNISRKPNFMSSLF